MLSISTESVCDVCIEEFGKEQRHRPRVLPCGHVLCATCAAGIIRSAPGPRKQALCPFCRREFSNDNSPFLRVDGFSASTSNDCGNTHESVKTRGADEEEDSGEVDHKAFCNLCYIHLWGIRHKCLTCPDYDVCDMCISAVNIRHPYHAFVKVTTAQNLMDTSPVQNQVHGATCDHCNKQIHGIRYKCLHFNCPDYDLCEDCESLPIPVHPHSHPMLKIRDINASIPSIPSIRCPFPNPMELNPLARELLAFAEDGHGRRH